jgi:monofunctional biosynthetic peptidoglycan transglycosylase
VVCKTALVFSAYYGFCIVCLLLYNVINPPTTGVQLQRRVESWFEEEAYRKRYRPVARDALSLHLRHATVAAEDGRFYTHWGIDWEAIRQAREDNRARGSTWRGGSTITQQLVKNLFMTTHSNYLRKAMEVPLTYLAELLLSKERILDLYLNVIEWDRGVYGAEAAAQHYYGASAAGLSRYQAAGLAACIPAPRARTPQRMGSYTNTILHRMHQMNW